MEGPVSHKEGQEVFPVTTEFKHAAINEAVDRRAARMFREGEFTPWVMARFFNFDNPSKISAAMYDEFIRVVKISIQQLVIGGVKRMIGAQPKATPDSIGEVEHGDINVDGGVGIYHDIMHTFVGRMMSKRGSDPATLRPNYQKRGRGPWVHAFIPGKSGKSWDDANVEEAVATMLYDDGPTTMGDKIVKARNTPGSEEQKFDTFLKSVFAARDGSYAAAMKSHPQVIQFLKKIYTSHLSNPQTFYDEYRVFMAGI